MKIVNKMVSILGFLICLISIYGTQVLSLPRRNSMNKNRTDLDDMKQAALVQYKDHMTRQGILCWKKGDHSYIYGRIKLHHCTFVLPSSGLYEVQTRLQIDTYTQDIFSTGDTLVRIAINVKSKKGHVRTLLEEKFILEGRKMFGKQLGPVAFDFLEGDSVYVVMSNPVFVNPTRYSIFAVKKWPS